MVAGVGIELVGPIENTQVVDSAYYDTYEIAQNNEVLAEIWPNAVLIALSP